jgi:hypothetical protein
MEDGPEGVLNANNASGVWKDSLTGTRGRMFEIETTLARRSVVCPACDSVEEGVEVALPVFTSQIRCFKTSYSGRQVTSLERFPSWR